MDKLKLASDEANEAAAVARPRGESAVAGQRARVLYDYQAEEDNELNLAEGAIVEGVEQVDEGWWTGSLNGESGLFPGM